METFSVLMDLCEGIHRWPADSSHKGQLIGALMISLSFAWTDGWTNNRDAGDLRRHRAHYNVTDDQISDTVYCMAAADLVNSLYLERFELNVT